MSRYFDDLINDTSANSLEHFGIKGQKWGRRNYQYEDGSLTPDGRLHYGIGDGRQSGISKVSSTKNTKSGTNQSTTVKKSDHRLKLEAKYQQQGMSKEDAEKAADKRIKTEKAIAIAGGIAIGSAVAIVAAKKYKDYTTDIVLKEDQPMYRMQIFNGHDNKSGAIYAVYDKKDAQRYNGIWAKQNRQAVKNMQRMGQNVDNYAMTLNYRGGAKIASQKKSRDEFAKMYRENKEFRDAVLDRQRIAGAAMAKQRGMADAFSKGEKTGNFVLKGKGYDQFNIALGGGKDSKAAQMYFDHMSKLGYNGINDVNDQKYSGYNAKTAAIMFNGKYKWKAKNLTDEAIDSNFKSAQKMIGQENAAKLGKKVLTQIGLYGAALGGVSYAESRSNVNRAYSMSKSGVSRKEIAKQLGISESQVNYLIQKKAKQLGISESQVNYPIQKKEGFYE